MNSGYYTESSASYGLYDLNADGIPELIINTAPYGIYAMDGNNCVELQSSFTATRSPSLSLTDKGFIKTTFVIPPGEAAVSYWKYFGGSQLTMQDDGGAELYVRKDLTDGWRIKAVNEYYDGYYWYELYDADDGDYYGWVSAEVINFY